MIKGYVEQLISEYPKIESIWLFGSRANNTERPDSDWDLLVFSSRDVLKSLRKDSRFRLDRIDLLVVHNNEDFEEPWGEVPKHGNLSEWEWKKVDSNVATYCATKPIYDKNGKEDFCRRKVMQCKAIRVYP